MRFARKYGSPVLQRQLNLRQRRNGRRLLLFDHRCCSFFSTNSKEGRETVRLGLGSYKYAQMVNSTDSDSAKVYDEIIRVALLNGVSTLEASGVPGGELALANAYRKAVDRHPEIAEQQQTDILLRVGYRERNNERNDVSFPSDIPQPNSSETPSNTTIVHNLSPMYIQHVLQESALTTLCQEYPLESIRFTAMLHNPEAQGDGTPDSQWAVHDVLKSAFAALEDFCEGSQDNAFITRYGVVSNGLNLPSSQDQDSHEHHPMALSIDTLWNAVHRATASRGLSLHNTYFGALQLPVNRLENHNDNKVTQRIRELSGNTTQLYGMRPLHCYPDGGMGTKRPWLLADYYLQDEEAWTHTMTSPPVGYDGALKRVLGHLDADDLLDDDTTNATETDETRETARWLQSMIQDMDASLSTLQSVAEYHDILTTQTIEPLARNIEAMDEETADLLGTFFHQHGQAARYAIAQRTRQQLLASPSTTTEPLATTTRLQELGLQYALENTDTVILNCSSVEHVLDAIAIARKVQGITKNDQEEAPPLRT